MKKVKVIGIKWDIEREDLPTTMVIDIPESNYTIWNSDLEAYIDGAIANQAGTLHSGWERYEVFETNPSIEQWESKYKPIANPNAEDECSADRFETCGEDLDYVLNIANTTPKKVWTLEDIDGQLIICAGYHLVNRINYFVTEIEWEDENIEVQYCDEDKLCFSTIEDGLVKIKEAYRNSEVVEGEFADYLVNNYNECFDSTVYPLMFFRRNKMTYSELVDKIHADTTGIAKGYDISFLQELFVRTMKTSEDFDKLMARDLKMFSEIEHSLLNSNEPKEGEFVEFDGNIARICSTRFGDKFQLSNKIGVYVSDSCSQASGCTWDCDIEIENESERLKLSNLMPTGKTMKGRCWTFSDRDAGGGRGVWFEIEFKVWSLGGLA